jgi:hypothetical protein
MMCDAPDHLAREDIWQVSQRSIRDGDCVLLHSAAAERGGHCIIKLLHLKCLPRWPLFSYPTFIPF